METVALTEQTDERTQRQIPLHRINRTHRQRKRVAQTEKHEHRDRQKQFEGLNR